MSIEAIVQVWDKSKQKGTKLLLLIALADWANDDGVCWPAISSMAKKIRMSEKYTKILLSDLIASKELKIIQHGGGGRNTNYYRIFGLGGRPASRLNRGEAGLPSKHTEGRRASKRGEAGLPQSFNNHHLNRTKGGTSSFNGADAPKDEQNPLTPAAVEYLHQFGIKQFKSKAQRTKFSEAESMVGGPIMLDVVAWAALKGISDMNRIYSAAKNWNTGKQPPAKYTKPASVEPAGFEGIREYKRRKAGGK